MMKHLSIEYNLCTVCGKTYFNLQAYKRHIEKHLKANESPPTLLIIQNENSQKFALTDAKHESSDDIHQ